MANVYLQREDNRVRALESYVFPKFHELWSTNGLRPDRSFIHPHALDLPYFCPSLSHTLYAALTWRPTATLNEATLNSSAAQI